MNPIIFAFSGQSNSGKTTLICKLCEYLHHTRANVQIGIIKHDPKDKAQFDTPQKDSYRFFQLSSAVGVISPTRTTLQIHHAPQSTQDSQEIQAFHHVLKHFAHYDYVFIEGLKTLPYPRIVVARDHIESAYIPYANAFAIHNVDNLSILPPHIKILDLNDIAQIADFIDTFTTIKDK
ncbi:molybdopterin-guanine dinucleotide biosynthesis protein B [Helicobacter sp. MIT 05-5293]|uniref:molybdopterin-guanine dinucleotide biosynthesis protein B n=1 Tax=Helicobacter sp. MIT 05-5293 TaxID=1548149 RepID=UPI00051D2FBF|nr:molybdopterin-guanine dinucleotide biosynthesis protein B [Helicobacter sp. MIT 05-5293]TLD80495.1 molybdopterin-guanine dinucleotide biosynthesis protein B [Helicobacter sp. MIT 05-5293]